MRSYRPSRLRPAYRFRLYPEGSLYVVVNVWDSRADLLKYSDEDDTQISNRRGIQGTANAIEIIDIRRGRPARKKPIFAEVNLYRGMLGTEVITHEFFHATMAWGRRVGFAWQRLGDDNSVTPDEERITYVHGRLCRDFVARATAAGLYS